MRVTKTKFRKNSNAIICHIIQGNLLFHVIKDIHILITLLYVKYSVRGRTVREYKNHFTLNS